MPKSILSDHRLLSALTWAEIDDLMLARVQPRHLKGDRSIDELENEIRRSRESELLRYRSRHGLLDIGKIEQSLFRQQFRFDKDDIPELLSALRVPEEIVSAQNVKVSGCEALCITLRRLVYRNRWCDLEPIFGRHSSVMSSVTSQVISHITATFGYLLSDCNNHHWLSRASLKDFSNAIRSKGTPLHNCWAFVDGTARPICRPKRNQQAYFSGHKRVHCLKYQSFMCPNGIICQLDGPYPGRRHDADILQESQAYEKLERLVGGQTFVVYGDPAYPLRPLLMKPYAGAFPTASQRAFNYGMSQVRQAVEWGFGKIVSQFAFLDYKKNQKLLKQEVSQMYKGATILTNCHTCMYGSQVSSYFGLHPPDLVSYLRLPA
ncbi:uncharacterized protein [Dermacentor albipictus]|uniref:uncharacterized protein n=1 Tax=Dermacentor albipictus TaxID=60249 RepID=UPI0031FC31E9